MNRFELRMAIWLAYSKKDIYTGQLIENFADLEIDHIIPKSIDKNVLNEKISKYSLGEKFTINSIENLVPTFKLYNREKSEIIFNESTERFFLSIAKGKKKMVEEELFKIIKNRKLKEKVQFKKFRKVTDTEQYGLKATYFHSNTLIALNGYLPSKFDEVGSCAVEFYEMGTMITLSHKMIMELINGNKHLTLEKQILHYYNEKIEKAFIIIGTSSLLLRKEAYDQFLEIMDSFLIEYTKFLRRFKSVWGLCSFEKYEEHYVLREITEKEWDYLIAYSYMHDIDSQSENTYCFNATPNSLIVLEKHEPIIKFTVTSRPLIDKRLLLWHFPPSENRKFIDNGKVWPPFQTLVWINNLLKDLRSKEDLAVREKDSEKKNPFFSLINIFRNIINSSKS